MFGSLSSCTPNSVVTTSFTSDQNQILGIGTDVVVTVNGFVTTVRPVTLSAGDYVEATVTTPGGYLGYNFYPYTLNGRAQCFAVVNKNNYSTVTVKPADSRKRWYNYLPTNFTVSFYQDVANTDYLLGFGQQYIDVDQLHIVLNPLHKAVYFYSAQRVMICRVGLPDNPVNYKKIPADSIQGTYTQELLVLCSNGRLYRIKFNTRYINSDEFKPAVLPVIPLEDLPYLVDLPGGGSFTDAARAKFLRSLFPVVSALDFKNNLIWLAGSNTVYVTNKNFVLQHTITVGATNILDIACLGNNAVVVTKDQRVYYITPSGGVTLVYTGGALGSPCTMPDGMSVAIPDANGRQVIIFKDDQTYTTKPTPDYFPAYAFIYENDLWITGHDSNRVIRFFNNGTVRYYDFNLKTALVSMVSGSILGIHCMQDFSTLENTNLQKIIPYRPDLKVGPLSHVGTRPHEIKLLGRSAITAIPGPGVTCWINGKNNDPIETNDWITASYKSLGPGMHRACFIIGETVIDFDVITISSADLRDHFLAGSPRLYTVSVPYTFVSAPTQGTRDEGITYLGLGFDFTVFGTTYTNIGVTTNGYIGFGNSVVINTDPIFGSLSNDAIYAEPKDLYQGFPVDNTNPLDVKDGVLDSGETPGVYYKSFDLDLFKGFKVKWVGTSMDFYPLGNTNYNVTTTSSWPEIPVPDYGNINIGDFVSGGGISISTIVTNKVHEFKTANVYKTISGTTVLLNSQRTGLSNGIVTPAIRRYSTITDSDNTILGYSNVQTSRISNFGRIIGSNGNTLFLSGFIDALVTIDYEFIFSTAVGGTGITEIKTDAIAINYVTDSFVALIYYPSTRQFLVSQADYDRITLLNQQIAGTASLITSKSIINRTITVSVDKSQVVEGNSVVVSVTTTNVPNGFVIPYQITGATLSDFVGRSSLLGTVTINSGSAALILNTNVDVDIEVSETVTITFGNISDILTSSVSVSFDILDSGVDTLGPVTASTSATEYAFFADVNIGTTAPGTTISLRITSITFGSSFSATNEFVSAAYNAVNVDTVITKSVPFTANFEGNFVLVNNSVSLSSLSSLLFKNNVPAPSYSYEVGFYTGRNFQYIEIINTNNNHKTDNEVGISTASPPAYYSNIALVKNTNVVFGSYKVFGDWTLLGLGAFNKTINGFFPRELEFQRVAAQDSTYARFEAFVDQKFPLTANAYISTNYGFLYINHREDINQRPLRTNDLVTINIPFGRYKTITAPLISIGDFQQAVPAMPQSEIAKYSEVIAITDNVPNSVYMSGNITVTQAGEYIIPEYYRSTITNDPEEFVFKIKRGATTTVVQPSTVLLGIGDIIQVDNIYTSPRIYDTRTITIIGPAILKIILRTASGSVFDFFNFGTLENPYTRQYSMQVTSSVPLEYEEKITYKTNDIVLTSSAAMTGKLVVNTGGIEIYINGVRQTNNLNLIVDTGSTVNLEWLAPNYFQNNIYLFQQKTDPLDSSNVFIPVGIWSVNNLPVVNEPVLFSAPEPLLVFRAGQMDSKTTVLLSSTNSSSIRSGTVLVDAIGSDFVASNGTLVTDSIVEDYRAAANVITAPTADPDLIENNNPYITGRIGSNTIPSQTVIESDAVVPEFEPTPVERTSDAAKPNGVPMGTEMHSATDSEYVAPETLFTANAKSEYAATGDPIKSDSSVPEYLAASEPVEYESSNPEYLAPAPFVTSSNEFDIVDQATAFNAGTIPQWFSPNELIEVDDITIGLFKTNLLFFDTSSPGLFEQAPAMYGGNDFVKVDVNILLPGGGNVDLVQATTSFLSGNDFVYQAPPTLSYSEEFIPHRELPAAIFTVGNQWLFFNSPQYLYSSRDFNLIITNSLLSEMELNLEFVSLMSYGLSNESLIDNELYLELTNGFYYYNLYFQEIVNQLEIMNEQYGIIDREYYFETVRLINLASNYETQNPRFMPIVHEYEVPNPRLLPIVHEYEIPNPRMLPLVSEFVFFRPRLIQLNYEFFSENKIIRPLDMQFVIAKPLEFPLTHQVHNLEPIQVPLPLELYQEKIWEMLDFTNYGAFDTYFMTYADGGRGGDNLLNLGVVTPRNKGPYLRYESNTGAALGMGNDHGVYYIHSGNILTHINGMNWHYNIDYTHSNINVETWTLGTGSTPKYFALGDVAENKRIIALDPYDQKNIIWEANGTPDMTNAPDQTNGGWETDWFPIDPNKSYRSVVWVKRVSDSANGIIYHGMYTNGSAPAYPNSEVDGNGDPITTGSTVRITDNQGEWDPSWSVYDASAYVKDQWYLHVGVIYPKNYPSTEFIDQTGIYDINGKRVKLNNGKVAMGIKFPTDAAYAKQRVFALFAYDTTTKFHFAFPRFEVLDLDNPTVPALCRLPETIKFRSNANVATVNSSAGTLSFMGVEYPFNRVPGRYYGYGSYKTLDEAQVVANKFVNATPLQITATDYWNYRLYFDYVKPHYSVLGRNVTHGREAFFMDHNETLRIESTTIASNEIVSYRIDPAFVELEYVVVGAGGGGGSGAGGGGGGGSVYYGFKSNIELETDYPVTIGAGGRGGIASTTTIIGAPATVFTTLSLISGTIKRPTFIGTGWSQFLKDNSIWQGSTQSFSFTRTFTVAYPGYYQVQAAVDDDATVTVDGTLILTVNYNSEGSASIPLTTGSHTITVSASNINGAPSGSNFAGLAVTITGPTAPITTLSYVSTKGANTLFADIEAIGGDRGGDGDGTLVLAKYTAVNTPKFEDIPADSGLTKTDGSPFNETFFITLAAGTYTVISAASGFHSVYIDNLNPVIIGPTSGIQYYRELVITTSGSHRLRVYNYNGGLAAYVCLVIKNISGITVFNLRDRVDTSTVLTVNQSVNGGSDGSSGGGGGSFYDTRAGTAGSTLSSLLGNNGGAGTILSGGGGGGAGSAGENASIVTQTAFETATNIALGNVYYGEVLTNGVGIAGRGGHGNLIYDQCWTIGAGGGGGSSFYSNVTGVFGGNGGLYGGGDGGGITTTHGEAGSMASGGGGGGGFVRFNMSAMVINYEQIPLLDVDGNVVLDMTGNIVTTNKLDANGDPIITSITLPQVSSTEAFNGGNGAGGVVMLKYSKNFDIYLDPGLTGETLEMKEQKLTVITAGLGNIRWKVPCFPEEKRVCSPRRGLYFPIKWWIKGG